MEGITGFGMFLLVVFCLRGIGGFREDYLYFKHKSQEKFSIKNLIAYYKKSFGKNIDEV